MTIDNRDRKNRGQGKPTETTQHCNKEHNHEPNENIRVNSVHPGYIWTPLVENLAKENGQDPDEFRQELAAKHPIGHVGDPEDIANGILYLASDESKFVTGSELVIDGGYTCQ